MWFRGKSRGKNRCVSEQDATRRGRWRSRRPPLALAYHAVADGWDDPLAVTAARFEIQVRHLREMGYAGVRFTDLAHSDGRQPVVAITFDDAFSSVRSRALPLL